MLKRISKWWMAIYHQLSLRNIVWVSFSVTAALATIFMGISFYSRFSTQLRNELQMENQALINQVSNAVNTYVRNMMKLSDTLYFKVIKDVDIQKANFNDTFRLLYEVNKDSIKNIALFSEEGEPVVLAPAASLKEGVNPSEQDWFRRALEKSENMHFSTLHIQNLFNENNGEYEWVISLSRAVQMTDGSEVKQGVLLIDMTYEGIKQLFSNISLGQEGYIYMMDQTGAMIYHPRQQLLASGIYKENTQAAMTYNDGIYYETFGDKERQVIIKTVGYTGWTIGGVVFPGAVSLNSKKSNIFFIFLFLFFTMGLVLINSVISTKVSKPIRNLEEAVKEVEMGKLDTCIKAEGFYEVHHLGQSVHKMAQQIKKLMEDIVIEHESKRKSELDALQSQINPHFLYNTLDIIVWMIENERQQDAARVVTALARFFRISLSKGKHIISIADEMEHVRNYLTIQQLRYKDKFEYKIEIAEEVKLLSTVKLIIQPLVENAIYHGMVYMDGEGLIRVQAYIKDDEVYIAVSDNGLGMTRERMNQLLKGEVQSSRKGSGIGVSNVNERIKLYFGDAYGIRIESEPDEGTKMSVHLPKVIYNKEEKGEGR